MTPLEILIDRLDAEIAALECLVETSQREQAAVIGLSIQGLRGLVERKAELVSLAEELAREAERAMVLAASCVSLPVPTAMSDLLPSLPEPARGEIEHRVSCLRSLAAAQAELDCALSVLVERSRVWLGDHMRALLRDDDGAGTYGPVARRAAPRGILLEAEA